MWWPTFSTVSPNYAFCATADATRSHDGDGRDRELGISAITRWASPDGNGNVCRGSRKREGPLVAALRASRDRRGAGELDSVPGVVARVVGCDTRGQPDGTDKSSSR